MRASFQCTGDAVQCAVAKATNKTECALKSIKIDDDEPLLAAGRELVANGTSAFGQAGGLQSTSRGLGSLDYSNPYGGGSCPPDLFLFSFKGSSYSLPLSKYCGVFELMGSMMLVLAGIVSLRIITGGF